jgi:hypothetical protein
MPATYIIVARVSNFHLAVSFIIWPIDQASADAQEKHINKKVINFYQPQAM